MISFGFQSVIFILGCMAGISLGIIVLAYKQNKRPNMRARRVINGDMVGGNIVGRKNMGTMTINGRTYTGRNISIINDRVIIDGKDVTADYQNGLNRVVEIKVLEGTIENLTTDASVTCNDVTGNVDAGGSVSCGNVGGDTDAGGSINCGAVSGSVDAGGSVNCSGSVGGNIDAGGSVRHG